MPNSTSRSYWMNMGETAGIITLEDILDGMVGENRDEYDEARRRDDTENQRS